MIGSIPAPLASVLVLLVARSNALATTGSPVPSAPTTEEGAASAPAADQLEIMVVGPQERRDFLIAAVAPLVPHDARVAWQKQEDLRIGGADRGARILIDLSTKGSVRIIFSAPGRPTLVRFVDADELTPVVVEVIAQILCESAHALLADGPGAGSPPTQDPPGAPRLEPPPAFLMLTDGARPATASQDPPSPLVGRLAFTLGYAVRTIFESSSYPEPIEPERGLVGSVMLFGSRNRLRSFVSLTVGWMRLSTPAGGNNFGYPALDLDQVSTRALVGLAARPIRWIEIGVAAGAGMDLLMASAGETASGWVTLPALEAALHISVLTPFWGLEAFGALTVDFEPRASFTESVSPSGDWLFQWTKRMQPGVAVGVGWAL